MINSSNRYMQVDPTSRNVPLISILFTAFSTPLLGSAFFCSTGISNGGASINCLRMYQTRQLMGICALAAGKSSCTDHGVLG